MENQCEFIYDGGRRCRCYKLRDSSHCINHTENPKVRSLLALSRRRGGLTRRRKFDAVQVGLYRLKNIAQCRQFWGHVLTLLYEDKIDSVRANSIFYGLQGFIKSFRVEREERSFLNELKGRNVIEQLRKGVGVRG